MPRIEATDIGWTLVGNKRRRFRRPSGKMVVGLGLVAGLAVGGNQVYQNREEIFNCPSGFDLAKLPPGCADGPPDPVTSQVEMGVAGTVSDKVRGVVKYAIGGLSPQPDGIAVVTNIQPDPEKYALISQNAPLEDLTIQRYVSTIATEDPARGYGAETCAADLARVVRRAQAGADSLAGEVNGVVITADQIRDAENLYTLEGQGGNQPDNPDIPNIYIAFDTGQAAADGSGNTVDILSCVPLG